MSKIPFFLTGIIILIFSCEENIEPVLDLQLYGTWQQVHLTRYDTLNNITQTVHMDSTIFFIKQSFFETRLQAMYVGRRSSESNFVIFAQYRLEDDMLEYSPDSLMSVQGSIHIWNPVDSSFVPSYAVGTNPFTSIHTRYSDSTWLETREFETQRLEILWEKVNAKPLDLKIELQMGDTLGLRNGCTGEDINVLLTY